jgi:hypothetical protein
MEKPHDADLQEIGNDASVYAATKGISEYLDKLEEYYNHLYEVGFYPHAGQQKILRRLFSTKFKIKRAFCQCSRNFGKTTTAGIYIVWGAGLSDNTRNLVIGPYLTLMKEIYSDSGLIETLIPPSWWVGDVKGFNKSELRWKLKTKSFIKLEGADNPARLRGIKPHRVVWDEFQDVKSEASSDMEPNYLAHKSPVFYIGTPPKKDNAYTAQAALISRDMREGKKEYFYFKATVYDNPRLDRDEIEKIKSDLLAKGDRITWEREYLANFVRGGASIIFPQFSRTYHFADIGKIRNQLSALKKNELQGYTILDPSANRFACSGFIYHEPSGFAWWVFAFAETDSQFLTNSQLCKRIKLLEKAWSPYFDEETVIRVYDEAAKLTALDLAEHGLTMGPTAKGRNKKDSNINLARDMLFNNKIAILEDLEEVAWELENYCTDDKGEIVKKDDDLIDTYLYFVAESGYTIIGGGEVAAEDGQDALSTKPGIPRNETMGFEEASELMELDSDFFFEGDLSILDLDMELLGL